MFLHLGISFLARAFIPQLQEITSPQYIELKRDVELILNRTYQDVAGFVKAVVQKFSKGSVVVDFELIFDTKTAGKDTKEIQKRVEDAYKKATADKSLGNFTVTEELKILKVQTQVAASSSTSTTIATWVIVLIVSCVVLLALLILLVLQWVCPLKCICSRKEDLSLSTA